MRVPPIAAIRSIAAGSFLAALGITGRFTIAILAATAITGMAGAGIVDPCTQVRDRAAALTGAIIVVTTGATGAAGGKPKY